MRRFLLAFLLALPTPAAIAGDPPTLKDYFDTRGRGDAWQGGVRMIPIHTVAGDFRVWTRRVGNNPRIKVLLLHGGPGATHEPFEVFDSFLPADGIEYYYYDQLGSYYSDQPDDPRLLTIDRFVEEVEQVRRALGLGRDNFYLFGHSWGGILAMEYALKYPQHLKGLVIADMMSSVPAYNRYASDVLMPELGAEALAELKRLDAAGDYTNPRFEALLQPHYERHILRRPMAEWPEPVLRGFVRHLNPKVYVPMQGPSELGARGIIEHWDRTNDLEKISVPTLVIGARYDTMDPKFMEKMSRRLPHGEFLYLANGSHVGFYDDQQAFFAGLLAFLHRVDDARP
ncbi:proline iminopeptidase-family hydrolase [Lysobacter niabensis]|uniref:proline iminopeptidase-family hydrolase n=1 Tax=Agrilutibacter niabensis TaxID=380628 RepID=UPI0036142C4A